jgi:membrane-bound ClpP family serine protease
MLDQPAVVLLAVALAAVLFLLEVALPTGGLAGAASAVGVAVAVWGISSQDADWWPLALVAAAITVWGALVAVHRSPVAYQAVAACLYAGGAVGFGVANHDGPAIVVAVLTSVGLPLAFPSVSRAADRLVDLPAQMGLESLPGRRVRVLAWEGESGTVGLDGAIWQARGPAGLTPGSDVTVVASERMTLVVGASMPA